MMWEIGIKGKMWKVVRALYASNRSCDFLEEKDFQDFIQLIRGVAQDCTLSPTLFLIHIDGIICEIEKHPQLGIKIL